MDLPEDMDLDCEGKGEETDGEPDEGEDVTGDGEALAEEGGEFPEKGDPAEGGEGMNQDDQVNLHGRFLLHDPLLAVYSHGRFLTN